MVPRWDQFRRRSRYCGCLDLLGHRLHRVDCGFSRDVPVLVDCEVEAVLYVDRPGSYVHYHHFVEVCVHQIRRLNH